ncbi:MAG: hypothetical protein ACRCU2_23260 [Planktothrix sp.]
MRLVMDELQRKFKQRQALEDAYSNFVEPHINQFLEVKVESMTTVPVTSASLVYASGWLLLVMLYSILMRGFQR